MSFNPEAPRRRPTTPPPIPPPRKKTDASGRKPVEAGSTIEITIEDLILEAE